MSTEKNIATLKFNQLSQAKYDTITPVEGEFYITGDEDLVHKTGNETINGGKTFSSVIKRSSTIDQSTTSGEVEVGSITVYDKDGNSIGMYNTTRSNTTNTNRQRVINKNVTGSNWFDFRVNVNDAGTGHVSIAKGGGITTNGSLSWATNSTTDEVIPTKGWVNNPATSTNVVHRSGNETIAGTKTFSTTPVVGTLAASNNSTSAASTAWVNNWKDANTSDVIVVIESYVNGTNWYRVWSDGWIEQGGFVSSVTSNSYTSATVTLLKNFINTNYTCIISQYDNGQQLGLSASTGSESIHSKTTSSFVISTYSWTYGRGWYACGQGE